MKTDDKIIDKIKKIMSENESLYKVSPSLFDPLFEAGEIVTFPRGYMIMKAGRQLRDVYVIIDGLVGSFYESGSTVILHGLTTPGTLLIHGASFFNVKPSFMHWEAVVATTALRVPDSFIREYLHSCHEFAIWMYGMAENVIMYSEDKLLYCRTAPNTAISSSTRICRGECSANCLRGWWRVISA